MEVNSASIQAELERIQGSRCFRSRRTLQQFLAYIVKQAQAGNAANITQRLIAVDGLGRPSDFDAAIDPSIRVQAGRLRAQLDEYYATEGRFNPLRITVPSRSYQPIFTPHQASTASLPLVLEDDSPILSQGPSVVCIPRTFIADEAYGWPFITRLASDYVSLLTRFSFCQVIFADETLWQQTGWPNHTWRKYGADFALFLDLHTDDVGYCLKSSLVHRQNSQILWAHSFSLGGSYPAPAIIDPIFKRIAHDTVAYDPGLTHTYWVRQLLDSGKPLAPHHQVLAAVRQYIWNQTPATFRTSLRVCEQRLEQVPHDVTALFVYVNHCFTEYAVKYHVIESIPTKVADAADAMLQLAPGNAYSHAYHALACLLADEPEQCRAALEKTQAINALDSYLNVHVGLIYLALGEWEMGAKYIQDSINVSPVYPDWYHLPLCVCHYREGRYLTAMQEAKKIRLKHLWTPMLRTALYQCNHRLEKGAQEYGRLVNEYPDFVQKSHNLMQGFPQKANGILHQLWSHVPSYQWNKPDDKTADRG
jgi:tetratricopeptide (TPR) repeat protein